MICMRAPVCQRLEACALAGAEADRVNRLQVLGDCAVLCVPQAACVVVVWQLLADVGLCHSPA